MRSYRKKSIWILISGHQYSNFVCDHIGFFVHFNAQQEESNCQLEEKGQDIREQKRKKEHEK